MVAIHIVIGALIVIAIVCAVKAMNRPDKNTGAYAYVYRFSNMFVTAATPIVDSVLHVNTNTNTVPTQESVQSK